MKGRMETPSFIRSSRREGSGSPGKEVVAAGILEMTMGVTEIAKMRGWTHKIRNKEQVGTNRLSTDAQGDNLYSGGRGWNREKVRLHTEEGDQTGNACSRSREKSMRDGIGPHEQGEGKKY